MDIANDCLTLDLDQCAGTDSAYLRLVPSSASAAEDGPALLRRAVREGTTLQEPCESMRLWSALCTGELRICKLVESDGQTIAFLKKRLGEKGAGGAPARSLEVLQRRLAGDSEKAIAFDLELSGSTVSSDIRRALETISLHPRTPGLMMLLARVYHAASSQCRLDATFTRLAPGDAFFVVTLPQLELNRSRQLAPAELEVCQLLLRGRSHNEIAKLRGTRPRTVSNQIASIFQKFKVSGRMTLMTELIRR